MVSRAEDDYEMTLEATLTEEGESIACHVSLADHLVDDAVTVAPDVEVARRL